jgi:hypothetical protein
MADMSYPAQLRPNNEELDIPACKFEIEYEDVFHLKNLYKRIYEWLVDEGWKAADGNDENYESLYWERIKQNETQEHHIWWRAYRIPEDNSYYRYFLKIDFQTLNMKKIEVMHRGQKFGTHRGDVIIRVQAYLQLDYNGTWEKGGLMKSLHPWFRNRIYFKEREDYKRDLYRIAYRLHTMIKQYLQFKPTMADWGRSFHPEKGV